MLTACIEQGTTTEAAKHLGIARTTISNTLYRLRKAADRQDVKAHGIETEHPVPHGYHIKGTSTYVTDDKGNKAWIKTDRDRSADLELARELYESMVADVPRLKPLPKPKECDSDLLTLYPLADAHLGMLAWYREGGRDWDLAIAEEVLIDAMRRMIQRSDKAKSCVIGQLGDWTHFDGLLPVTPGHGHVLDADGRASKIAEVSVRVMRTVIDDCLAHHEHVHLITAEGNHDMGSSVIYRVLYKHLYEHEPRLTVDTSPCPYYTFEHGKVMLGFHHGHLTKPANLRAYFASEHAPAWGKSKYRYGHCGHRHHETQIGDDHGMKVTQHSTLAAKDAHSSRHGYCAMSNATSTTYPKEYGEWSTATVTPKR
jgi:hypothetical protein